MSELEASDAGRYTCVASSAVAAVKKMKEVVLAVKCECSGGCGYDGGDGGFHDGV